jgi:thiol-disulfide isomerase/thioredoxin
MDRRAPMTPTGPTGEVQDLLAQLEKLDTAGDKATSPKERAQFNARRADLLEQIAEESATAEDRAMWVRQLADMVSAAVQSGEYPEGVRRLTALFEKLQKSQSEEGLAAYVRFRLLMAAYGQNIQTASTEEFVKIHSGWLKQLEQYVATYPKSPDAAEAMLQLGIAQEYAGEEEEAKKWYGQVAKQLPASAAAKKANGARARLESVGKSISLRGKNPSGGNVDLADYRGKVVLVQYWASWCEPCKADMRVLKDLLTKHGRSGFNIIGVNLDTNAKDMAAYLAESRLPWPQIFEEGGLDSRLANELGILTLPTMILVDRQGKVVNRNIHVVELDRELKNLIR